MELDGRHTVDIKIEFRNFMHPLRVTFPIEILSLMGDSILVVAEFDQKLTEWKYVKAVCYIDLIDEAAIRHIMSFESVNRIQ